jgi:F420 biosynthesis protein FbiB-like protein
VLVDTPEGKQALAAGMGECWRSDLEADGVTATRVDTLVDASRATIITAPSIVLGCLTWDGLDRYPDAARQRAEWGMALLSLGAAVENLMLAATDAGYASCWVAAPIFCPEAARDALALDREWLPHAMVLVGRPDPAYVGRPRPPVPLEELRAVR